MRILGPETADERELREWFESQERGNIEPWRQARRRLFSW